jgi:hypothetical protein
MRRARAAHILSLFLLIFIGSISAFAANLADSRDYLTPQEVELVKDAQELDKRIDVFIKAAERRLLVLTEPNAASNAQVQKDAKVWGELPKGTRTELMMDISNILDEAITNIDDVGARDAKNPLVPKALKNLASAANRFKPQLVALAEKSQDINERRAVEQVMAHIEEILSAANKQ